MPRLLKRLRARQPGAPLYRVLWWQAYHFITFVWFVTCYRFRAYGVRHLPDEGPVLMVSNHQSYLDPIVVGLGGSKRQFQPLARKTLWDSAIYRALVVPFGAIPVDQHSDAGDLKAMKACVEKMKQGHAVLVFPEGERTLDGEVHGFEAGVMLLIKRAKPTVVPVALEGPFAVWRRGHKLPKLFGRIGCIYGEPIAAEELLAMGKDGAREHLRRRVTGLRGELQEKMQR